MSASSMNGSHDVRADINYWPPEGAGEELIEGKIKARYLAPQQVVNEQQGTGDEYTRKMSIIDIRGREDEFTWQENGFQVALLPEKKRHEFDKQWTEEAYYPEVAEVLKKVTGAKHVFVINHVCRAAPDTTNETKPDGENPTANGPSANAHADFCINDEYMSTMRELSSARLNPDEKKILLDARRWGVFNTWKPVKKVHRDPLAMCDCRTVQATDMRLKKRELLPGKFIASTYFSHPHEEDRHQWYYLYEQKPEEMWIFRGYDSDSSRPRFPTGHTAIRAPEVGLDEIPARESIEARAIVVWD